MRTPIEPRSGGPVPGAGPLLLATGSRLAGNAVITIVARALPLSFGFFVIPYLLRHLGQDRFGILSFAWLVLGYFAMFDLGTGKATTKLVAEAIAAPGRSNIGEIFWNALGFQILAGLLASGCMLLIARPLAHRFLTVPGAMQAEATAVFRVLALMGPWILTASCLSGCLEASQRFDLVNAVNAPATASLFLVPALVTWLGFGIVHIATGLLLAQAIKTLVFFCICLRHLPPIRKRPTIDFGIFCKLLSFGGWMTLGNVCSLFVVYLDRLLLAMILSVGDLAYYTAPYELITKLLVIPASLVMVLFPAFSAMSIGRRDQACVIFEKAVIYLFLSAGCVTILAFTFTPEFLHLWLGPGFAVRSSTSMRILSVGVFANSLAYVAYALLNGFGRPDLAPKFYLLEAALLAAPTWFLVRLLGINGGALAWSTRVVFDGVLLFTAVYRCVPGMPNLFRSRMLFRAVVCLGTFASAMPLLKSSSSFGAVPLMIAALGSTALLMIAVWRWVLGLSERAGVLRVLKPLTVLAGR